MAQLKEKADDRVLVIVRVFVSHGSAVLSGGGAIIISIIFARFFQLHTAALE